MHGSTMIRKKVRTVPQLLAYVFLRPVFPTIQKFTIRIGIFTPPPRQRYVIGFLSVSIEEAVVHLSEMDFHHHCIAWPDPGQVASMRRLCNDRRGMQYHIRIFEDGEVRGHYERTPEDHPLKHLLKKDFEDRTDHFHSWVNHILND